MILPSKHLSQKKALLTVGARLLAELERPSTVSELWSRVKDDASIDITFDWFVLTLDLLYTLKAIDFRADRLHRARP